VGANRTIGGMRTLVVPRPRRLAPVLAVIISLSSHFSPVGTAAQSPGASRDARIDRTQQIKDLEALASPQLEGRRAGTAGNQRAQAIVLQRFKEIGLQPVNGAHQQSFTVTPKGPAQRRNEQEPVTGTNLFGALVKDGAAPWIVVGAHYDHLGVRNGQTFPGADDNASGVAALLALAQWFRAHPAGANLLFVAFDAEEEGLQGAKHFVAQPPIELKRVTAMVNMDMLGRGDANTLFVAGTRYSPALAPVVTEAAKGYSITVKLGHDAPPASSGGAEDWTNSSDHGPFHAAGVPFLYFGVEDHADYHKPTDSADKIPRPFYHDATELVLDVVARLADKR
jgi:hypothetical protein